LFNHNEKKGGRVKTTPASPPLFNHNEKKGGRDLPS